MIDKILVPTDGSSGTKKAVDYAIDVAEMADAELHTLYVVSQAPKGAIPREEWTTGNNWDDIPPAAEGDAKEAIDQVVEQAESRGTDVTRGVRIGEPHKEIKGYAEENEIDLIVMGTHGKTAIANVLIGSVTERVVRYSEIPVLTVKVPK
ncbi:MAG: universal stress protein [Halobacteria archaeon]